LDEFAQSFGRNPDGSWTCLNAVTLDAPSGRIQVAEGTVLTRGKPFMGVDLAAILEDGAATPAPESDAKAP
jgi:hypothetical protein